MQIIRFFAVLTIIVGIIGWILTFSVNPHESPFATAWQVTLLANPVGLILSIILIRKGVRYGLLLTVLNGLLFISFAPMWLFAELYNMLTGQ